MTSGAVTCDCSATLACIFGDVHPTSDVLINIASCSKQLDKDTHGLGIFYKTDKFERLKYEEADLKVETELAPSATEREVLFARRVCAKCPSTRLQLTQSNEGQLMALRVRNWKGAGPAPGVIGQSQSVARQLTIHVITCLLTHSRELPPVLAPCWLVRAAAPGGVAARQNRQIPRRARARRCSHCRACRFR